MPLIKKIDELISGLRRYCGSPQKNLQKGNNIRKTRQVPTCAFVCPQLSSRAGTCNRPTTVGAGPSSSSLAAELFVGSAKVLNAATCNEPKPQNYCASTWPRSFWPKTQNLPAMDEPQGGDHSRTRVVSGGLRTPPARGRKLTVMTVTATATMMSRDATRQVWSLEGETPITLLAELPEEVLLAVLALLDGRDLTSVTAVSSSFRRLALEDSYSPPPSFVFVLSSRNRSNNYLSNHCPIKITA